VVAVSEDEIATDGTEHPFAGTHRIRFACDWCGNEVSVYTSDAEPAAICDCGTPMDAVERSVDTGGDQS